jgi:hypothetical protein
MTCPICKNPKSVENNPFCSARCKDIDLSKWLIGGYVISNDEETESSEPEKNIDENSN